MSFAESAVAERDELWRANQLAHWHVLRGGNSSLRAGIKVRGSFLFSLECDLAPHPVYCAPAVPTGSTACESGLGCVVCVRAALAVVHGWHRADVVDG